VADLTELEASGMTVNERLFVSGSLEAFDDATARKDRAALAEILGRLFLTDNEIAAIIEQVLSRG
jgi:hypothetical protein